MLDEVEQLDISEITRVISAEIVGEFYDQKFKEKLLLLLMPTLQSLNVNKKNSKEVEEELSSSLLVKTSLKIVEIDFKVDPSSSLLVRMTLKIMKINPSKLNEKLYNITSEKVTDIGEKM
ncbi:25237_t:CDS:2 [Cetraspora pellucida]|uniref:25237_t:CDS:1 n=1 Tax=Cetraspora pellucida TaxID=1433469 RepID=A0A9N8ZZ41_9GLOM|nr:25237_t:CDS:2 [Cetraspora pellucida]